MLRSIFSTSAVREMFQSFSLSFRRMKSLSNALLASRSDS